MCKQNSGKMEIKKQHTEGEEEEKQEMEIQDQKL